MITLPHKIRLTATGKTWKVYYVHKPGKLMLLELPGCELAVFGKRYSKRAALKLIIRWIKMKARIFFNEELTKLNRKIKVKYKKLRVHSLEMEWGSYTQKKVLSLNYLIIFLPPSLMKHLMIHELCHIRHLNHSPKFWRKVAKYDKNWKRNQQALYKADEYIPKWVSLIS